MVYDANNAKVLESNKFPKDTILDGVIVSIEDGIVSNFITEGAKENWQGDVNANAIKVLVEVKLDDKSETFEQMFTYIDVNVQIAFY